MPFTFLIYDLRLAAGKRSFRVCDFRCLQILRKSPFSSNILFLLLFNYCFSKRIERIKRIKRIIKNSYPKTMIRSIRLIRLLFFFELDSIVKLFSQQ
jgi:hypothetical protein